LSRAERAGLEELLVGNLMRDGAMSSAVSDDDLAALRDSFRVLSNGKEVDFLDHVASPGDVSQSGARYYMIQADSGYGKTTFALSLGLEAAQLRVARSKRARKHADGVVPLYLDLSDFDAAMVQLSTWLTVIKDSALQAQRAGGLRDRPLFLL